MKNVVLSVVSLGRPSGLGGEIQNDVPASGEFANPRAFDLRKIET